MALILSDVKFWEAIGEEISIHMAFFVWHLKIALRSFYGIPTNASIIVFSFRATNSCSSDMKCKFVPSNFPQGISNSNRAEWSTIQGVIARVISKSDEREARGRFEITSTITPWIVRHEVQLLINRIYNKFRN